jgi:hypothetical protein
MRLETGGYFVEDFSTSLIMSHIAVAFVSSYALDRMTAEKIDADKVDNVLLEWTLIVELRDLKHLWAVIPILIGDLKENWTEMESLFISEAFKSLAEVVHRSVNNKVQGILKMHNLVPSQRLHTRTVKDIVVDLTHSLGLNAHEHYKYSHSFSRSGDQHKKADALKKLIQKVSHELILCHNLKASNANVHADHSKIEHPQPLHVSAKELVPRPAEELEVKRMKEDLEIEREKLKLEKQKIELEQKRLQVATSSCCVVS